MPAAAINYSTIYFDNAGKPYWLRADGSKVYLPPLVAMQSNDPRAVAWAKSMGVYTDEQGQITNQSAPGANFAQERGHWNQETGQWEQDTDWANIITTGLAAVPITAGAVATAGSIAGGGSGAGAGGGAGAGTTAGGGAAGGGAAAGGAAAAAPSFGSQIKDFLTDPSKLAGLAAMIPSLAGALGGGKGNTAAQDALLDEARAGMALQRGRIEQTQPAFDALVRMAYGNAPIRHRGPAPAGYQPPSGGYTYTPPRFGGQ